MKYQLVLGSMVLSLILLSCSQGDQNTEKVGSDIPLKQTHNKNYVPPASETGTSGEIYITVDESLQPIIEAEIAQFQGLYPRATIHPLYMPGEQAIQAMLSRDSIRLAIACRKMTQAEEEILINKTITPRHSHIFTEGIALINHKSNPVRNLSRQQLKDILEGKIKNWQELSPNKQSGQIRLVFDHPASSTIRYLKDSLLMGTAISKENTFAMENSPDVLRYVAEQTQSLGIIGVSWISDLDDKEMRDHLEGINVLRIEKPDSQGSCAYEQRYFGPYQSFLHQGCYPLRRPVFTLLREASFFLGTGFVSFLDGPVGQRIVHKAGLSSVHGIPRRVKFPPKKGAKNPLKTK